MGIYVPWLADAARATGYPVIESANWRTAGHGGMTSVEGVVGHHTAGSASGDYPSLKIVRDGRSDLDGPLANLGLGRSGTIYVIAAGKTYHAGESAWAGMENLNSRFLGIEAESTGHGDWTPEQIDCYPRLIASLLRYMSRDAGRYGAHREVALPKGRKPDPVGIDSTWMRTRSGAYLLNPATIAKNGPAVIRVVGIGDNGEDVKWVQERLVVWGYDCAIDGDFGPSTEGFVKDFQAKHGLQDDGLVGSVTRTALALNPTPAVVDPDTFVVGAIRDHWLELGGKDGILGSAITKEMQCPDKVGRYNHFEKGSIYWTPDFGAHAVYGQIRAVWERMGWEQGEVGYPLTDEFDHPEGRQQHFERAALYFRASDSAVFLLKKIL